jgi:hypothetical protein
MTEPSGRDISPDDRSLSSVSWIAFAGHLLVLMAAVTDALARNTLIVAALACSIIAVAALTELVPRDVRVRRRAMALIAGHGVSAAVLLSGLAASVSWWIPLAGLVAAAALGIPCRVVIRRASTMSRQSRPLTLAPRVAAIGLVVQALLQRWVASATGLSMPLRAAILLSIVAIGVALLASLSIIALRVRPRWVIAGLPAWTLAWVAVTVDLSALILWSLGGEFPVGPHQLVQLDAEFLQILGTVGGLVIGAALVTAIRDVRVRHSGIVLLVGYAVFGVVAAVAEHRIGLATDFPAITALRTNRDLATEITAFVLAGVLWLYWRRVAADRSRFPA